METELVPGSKEDEKHRMCRKWHRPESWRYLGERGMRFGELETRASPDWQFPELGAPGAGASGPAGVGVGAAVSSGMGRPRGCSVCLARPLQPSSGSSYCAALQLQPRALRRQGRDPASPKPPLALPTPAGGAGAGAAGGDTARAGVGLLGREGGSVTAGAGSYQGLRQDPGAAGALGQNLVGSVPAKPYLSIPPAFSEGW